MYIYIYIYIYGPRDALDLDAAGAGLAVAVRGDFVGDQRALVDGLEAVCSYFVICVMLSYVVCFLQCYCIICVLGYFLRFAYYMFRVLFVCFADGLEVGPVAAARHGVPVEEDLLGVRGQRGQDLAEALLPAEPLHAAIEAAVGAGPGLRHGGRVRLQLLHLRGRLQRDLRRRRQRVRALEVLPLEVVEGVVLPLDLAVGPDHLCVCVYIYIYTHTSYT